jgi:hypothetical protein
VDRIAQGDGSANAAWLQSFPVSKKVAETATEQAPTPDNGQDSEGWEPHPREPS